MSEKSAGNGGECSEAFATTFSAPNVPKEVLSESRVKQDTIETVLPIANVLRDVALRLSNAGVESAAHDASMLVAVSLGVSLSEVRKLEVLGEHVALPCDFWETVARREHREPLQHILGSASFRWLDLSVGEGVFIPRPETEQIIDIALDWLAQREQSTNQKHISNQALVIVDLCAGSGAIGLAATVEIPNSRVYAVELDSTAFTYTQHNKSSANKQFPEARVCERYQCIQADATALTMLAELNGRVDIVLTNPPYIPQTQVPEQIEVRDYDPALALYGGSDDGLAIPEAIIRKASQLLKPKGLLVLEHDISQGAALVRAAQSNGFTHARTAQDFTGRDRFLVCSRS